MVRISAVVCLGVHAGVGACLNVGLGVTLGVRVRG